MSTPTAKQATFEHVCQECGWTYRNHQDNALKRCNECGAVNVQLVTEISKEQLAREEREDWRENHAYDVEEER